MLQIAYILVYYKIFSCNYYHMGNMEEGNSFPEKAYEYEVWQLTDFHLLLALFQRLCLDPEFLLDVIIDLDEDTILIVHMTQRLTQSPQPTLSSFFLLLATLFEILVTRTLPSLDHLLLKLLQSGTAQ